MVLKVIQQNHPLTQHKEFREKSPELEPRTTTTNTESSNNNLLQENWIRKDQIMSQANTILESMPKWLKPRANGRNIVG